MSDWPGRVVSTIRLTGCSLSCSYCTDARSEGREPVDWEAILDEIGSHPWLDGVVVKGGEPTEDPDLPSLLAALCELGRAVRVETNGTRPDVLRHLIAEGLCDCVGLTIKAAPGRYGELAGRPGVASLVAQCAELLIRSGIEHEFRTPIHTASVALDDLPRIARSLRGGRLYALELPMGVRAGAGTPDMDAVRAAAEECRSYLPTVVRRHRGEGWPCT